HPCGFLARPPGLPLERPTGRRLDCCVLLSGVGPALQLPLMAPETPCRWRPLISCVMTWRSSLVLLLDANPLENVANAGRRIGVIVHGRWFSDADLRRLLQAQPKH